jgi:hypothetical protein
MRERPILMSAEMVRATLDDRKSQTRRILKDSGLYAIDEQIHGAEVAARERRALASRCPYGVPGDRLWVRETHRKIIGQSGGWIETDYRATYKHGERMGDHLGVKAKWTPSIHMPRAASRIALRITDVRVERLQDISEEDAAAEGWPGPDEANTIRNAYPIAWYSHLWEQINGKRSWSDNPFVWAVSFERVK